MALSNGMPMPAANGQPLIARARSDPLAELRSAINYGPEQLLEVGALARLKLGSSGQAVGVVQLEGQSDVMGQLPPHLLAFLEALRPDTELAEFAGMGSETDFRLLPVVLPVLAPGGQAGPSTSTLLDALELQQGMPGLSIDVFEDGAAFRSHFDSESPLDVGEEEQGYAETLATQRCAQRLADYGQPPFVRAVVGNEDTWNPIPVFWLTLSPCGDFVVGLMSSVVWT